MVHPLIKVMLVGGKGDGLMVSVADNAWPAPLPINMVSSLASP